MTIGQTVVLAAKFKVGDRVKVAKDGLQKHSKTEAPSAGYTRNQMSWRKSVSDLLKKNDEGTIGRVFEHGSRSRYNVDFDSRDMIIDMPEYMLTK